MKEWYNHNTDISQIPQKINYAWVIFKSEVNSSIFHTIIFIFYNFN